MRPYSFPSVVKSYIIIFISLISFPISTTSSANFNLLSHSPFTFSPLPLQSNFRKTSCNTALKIWENGMSPCLSPFLTSISSHS
uniref:Putative secreted protein n=1 Tax=Panstrongylus lignarius TaxID=156445 RepID=A0A224Y439_9HEMI